MSKLTKFAKNIVVDYPNLHVIAFNKDNVLAKDPVTGKAAFIYDAGGDMVFHFDMLCEVGERCNQWFKDTITKLNLNLETIETKTEYYDVITNIYTYKTYNYYYSMQPLRKDKPFVILRNNESFATLNELKSYINKNYLKI